MQALVIMVSKEYNRYQQQRSFMQRIWFFAFFVLLCFGVLFARFIWLQVVRYDAFFASADFQRKRSFPQVPLRGAIMDRNGVVLAYNASTYTVEIVPAQVKDMDATIAEIGRIVPLAARDVRRFRQALGHSRQIESLPLRMHLTREQVAALSAQLYRLPGVQVNMRFIREYPLKETASHVVGHMSRITEEDRTLLIETDQFENYRGTQNIGRVGIEAKYEMELHGKAGIVEMEVNARDKPIRRLREISSEPGHIVQLTLDVRMQRLVEVLYGQRRGALVAIDPRNGEVLALVSKPTFDPNLFIEGFDQETWDAMNDAVNRPLFHRAIGGAYPIGSTYKPFMALAGMQTGTRAPDEIYMDRDGTYRLGSRVWRSPAGERRGPMDAATAVTYSNNPYFYSLAYEMGPSKIHDFMQPWGFGELTGIDLNGEARGTLPTPQWRRENGGRWYDGDTVNLGIGQGDNRFTMLQLATAVAALANNGVKYKPHLLLGMKNVITGQFMPYSEGEAVHLNIDPAYIQVVRDAMVQVPLKSTARTAFAGVAYVSGGKTGTAQASSVPRGQVYNAAQLEEYKRDHSLYIAFAPAEEPKIAIAMIVENGGFGARSAVPIARRVLDYYLLGIYPSEADIAALQRGYMGAPQGRARSAESYDILPAEMLVPLSAIEISAADANAWNSSVQDVETVQDTLPLPSGGVSGAGLNAGAAQ